MTIIGERDFKVYKVSNSGLAWGEIIDGKDKSACLGPLDCSKGDVVSAIYIRNTTPSTHDFGICVDTSLWTKPTDKVPEYKLDSDEFLEKIEKSYPERVMGILGHTDNRRDVARLLVEVEPDCLSTITDYVNEEDLGEAPLQNSGKETDREHKSEAKTAPSSQTGEENETSESIVTTVQKTVQEYNRSPEVKKQAKERADGFCEGCGEPAPFESTTSEPYLHAHHLNELSEGGRDTIDNVVALCPNCHYRVHHGKDGEKYNQKLKNIVKES